MSKHRGLLIIAFCALCYSPTWTMASTDTSTDATDAIPDAVTLFNTFPAGFPASPDQPTGSRWLPPGRPFPSIPVDPRDLKIGFRKTNHSALEADVGGYRSIYGWKGEVSGHDFIFHTGIEGNAYFTMRKEGSRFPLESSDGLFGVYAEAAHNSWFYQFRFTHISAHLSDGITDFRIPIRYSREFAVFRVAKQVSWLRPYLGLLILTHSIPENLNAIGLQSGFYAFLPVRLGLFRPYFGADYRIFGGREGSTLNLGAGFALTSELGAPPLRFTINFLTGNDLRGQFFNEKVRKLYGGFELDF